LRWEDGLVPYFLEPNGSEALTAREIARFHTAVAEIELRTPVRFKEFDPADWDALPGPARRTREVLAASAGYRGSR